METTQEAATAARTPDSPGGCAPAAGSACNSVPFDDTAAPQHPGVDGCVLGELCWVTWQHGVEPGILKRWATLTCPTRDWHHALVFTDDLGGMIRRIELHNLFPTKKAARENWNAKMRQLRSYLNALPLCEPNVEVSHER